MKRLPLRDCKLDSRTKENLIVYIVCLKDRTLRNVKYNEQKGRSVCNSIWCDNILNGSSTWGQVKNIQNLFSFFEHHQNFYLVLLVNHTLKEKPAQQIEFMLLNCVEKYYKSHSKIILSVLGIAVAVVGGAGFYYMSHKNKNKNNNNKNNYNASFNTSGNSGNSGNNSEYIIVCDVLNFPIRILSNALNNTNIQSYEETQHPPNKHAIIIIRNVLRHMSYRIAEAEQYYPDGLVVLANYCNNKMNFRKLDEKKYLVAQYEEDIIFNLKVVVEEIRKQMV